MNRRSDFRRGLPAFADEIRFFIRMAWFSLYVTSWVVALYLTMDSCFIWFSGDGPVTHKRFLVGAAVYSLTGSFFWLYRHIVRLGRQSW
ncbi:MAG: hypothetical protein ACYDCF_10900 [Burkholderiales bacterium]